MCLKNHTQKKQYQKKSMRKEAKSSNQIYIVPELLEGIFLRLPLNSILKFKTVSKQWRFILESEIFVEKHMNFPKKRKIMAAYRCDCGDETSLISETRLVGDEEIVVYIHCRDARPSMTCCGLLCIPEPDSIIVLNPTTRQLKRFPSSPDHMSSKFINGPGQDFFMGNWVMGFGREKVTGRYKVVKMCMERVEKDCVVLDVESGEWSKVKVKVAPFVYSVGTMSVCVNGSIYWVYGAIDYKILALDLHMNEFHNVSIPANLVTQRSQIVNLEDRLAIAKSRIHPEWVLEIWCMSQDEEEVWSKRYNIELSGLGSKVPETRWNSSRFKPVAVCEQGSLVFCSDHNSLFKYYSETNEIQCLSLDVRVISPYIENLVRLWSESGHCQTSRCSRLFYKNQESGSRISKFLKKVILCILEFVLLALVFYFTEDSLTLEGLKTLTTTRQWWDPTFQTEPEAMNWFCLLYCYCLVSIWISILHWFFQD